MILAALLALILAAGLSAAATALVRRIARRVGFVDEPGGHKSHETPIALGGGIAIHLSTALILVAGTLLAQMGPGLPGYHWLPPAAAEHLSGVAAKSGTVAGIVACMTVLLFVGLVDDIRALGPWPKFAVQTAVALVTATLLGIRAAEALPPFLSIGLTVFWIVLITNAFNFLDNMDGLSAGVAAIAAAVLAVASWRAGQLFVPITACVMAGALSGFLIFNFSPAKIFMGDAGSLVVGYLLSVLMILTTFYDPRQGTRPLGVVVPLVILAVPLYDVASVIVHRLRAGQSPLKGDRRHFSHRLLKRGMSTRGAVLTIYLATAATALPAIVLPRAAWDTAVLLLVQCACVVVMIAILEHAGGSRS